MISHPNEKPLTTEPPTGFLQNLQKSFKPPLGMHRQKINVPPEHRANFRNLYMDVAWFGILNGTILSFLSVFATRAGATGQQIGLIAAAPAVANLLFSIPASLVLQKLPTARVVFWSSILQRIFYLGLAVLPFFTSSSPMIWALIIGTFLLSIPGTGLAVGINALIAQTVPVEWRAHVVSRRNSLLSLVTIATLALSGQLLTRLSFPINYQVVFFIGFLGGLLSCVHISLIRPHTATQLNHRVPRLDTVQQKSPHQHAHLAIRPDVMRKIRLANQPQKLSLYALKGKYGVIMLILFMYWFALFLSVPIFPIYQVKELHLTDQTISLGSSLFQVATLLGSTQIAVLARRHSNQLLAGLGLCGSMIYPLLLPMSRTPTIFIAVSAMGGIGWAMINSCLINYLLEHIPGSELAGRLAWYNLAMNAAVLAGSVLGPVIAVQIGLTAALTIFGLGRLLAGLALLRWG